MAYSKKTGKSMPGGWQRGFSLLELLVAMALLLIIAGTVMIAMVQMTRTEGTIWNRTEMHGAVRSATELLQQEVGQAGRVSLPAVVTLASAVTLSGSQTVSVTSAAGMFKGEQLVVDSGANQETVALTADPTGNQITAQFDNTHLFGAPVTVQGGFASGIVPTTTANGSTGTVLKLYGDINGDGNMVYVEYTCDTVAGNLYRNVMAYDAVPASKPVAGNAQILLSNVQPNPGGAACFTYQQKTQGADTYVVDVAITLTVQTQAKDPQTNQYQSETKALLNVSPRNVFDTWELAGADATNRIQPMPPSVKSLLP